MTDLAPGMNATCDVLCRGHGHPEWDTTVDLAEEASWTANYKMQKREGTRRHSVSTATAANDFGIGRRSRSTFPYDILSRHPCF